MEFHPINGIKYILNSTFRVCEIRVELNTIIKRVAAHDYINCFDNNREINLKKICVQMKATVLF